MKVKLNSNRSFQTPGGQDGRVGMVGMRRTCRWPLCQGPGGHSRGQGAGIGAVGGSRGEQEVQCSADQCSAVQCSAVQCSAVQCSAVQCSAVQCSAVQCSAVQCRGWRRVCQPRSNYRLVTHIPGLKPGNWQQGWSWQGLAINCHKFWNLKKQSIVCFRCFIFLL